MNMIRHDDNDEKVWKLMENNERDENITNIKKMWNPIKNDEGKLMNNPGENPEHDDRGVCECAL